MGKVGHFVGLKFARHHRVISYHFKTNRFQLSTPNEKLAINFLAVIRQKILLINPFATVFWRRFLAANSRPHEYPENVQIAAHNINAGSKDSKFASVGLHAAYEFGLA